MSKFHGNNAAEFAMLASDRFQCQGLGTELLRRLLEIAKNEQICCIHADILVDNLGMQRVCEKLDFKIAPTTDATVLKAEINFRDNAETHSP